MSGSLSPGWSTTSTVLPTCFLRTDFLLKTSRFGSAADRFPQNIWEKIEPLCKCLDAWNKEKKWPASEFCRLFNPQHEVAPDLNIGNKNQILEAVRYFFSFLLLDAIVWVYGVDPQEPKRAAADPKSYLAAVLRNRHNGTAYARWLGKEDVDYGILIWEAASLTSEAPEPPCTNSVIDRMDDVPDHLRQLFHTHSTHAKNSDRSNVLANVSSVSFHIALLLLSASEKGTPVIPTRPTAIAELLRLQVSDISPNTTRSLHDSLYTVLGLSPLLAFATTRLCNN